MRNNPLLPVLAIVAAAACARAPAKQAAKQPASDSVTIAYKWPPLATADTTIKFSADLATVRGVAVGDTEPAVKRVLGKPDSMAAYTDSILGDVSELFFHGAKVIIAEGRLAQLTCGSAECKNAKGVGVGSSAGDVLRALGRGEDAGDSLKHLLRYAIPNRDCSLVMVFNSEGVATEMNLLCRKPKKP